MEVQLELFLILWLGFAVVTGLAATGRNRSFLPWFLIGCIFGIFALLAVLVMKPEIEGHRGL